MSVVIPQTTVDSVGVTKAPIRKVEHSERKTLASGNGTSNFGRVLVGTVLGVITATGKVRPAARTQSTATATSATQTVADTSNFYVGDPFFIAGVDSTETVQSITNSTTLVLTGSVSVTSGDELTAGDGSDTAVGILAHDATTWLPDVDGTGAAIHADQSCEVVYRGVVDESECTGLDATLKADLTGITFT